ncbi:MAG: hypothetical protein HYY52_05940 [Candidatus Melainabacteria bacterium]|nr:hypothetical protein [Candidatus Melainabacteria bacterium]
MDGVSSVGPKLTSYQLHQAGLLDPSTCVSPEALKSRERWERETEEYKRIHGHYPVVEYTEADSTLACLGAERAYKNRCKDCG